MGEEGGNLHFIAVRVTGSTSFYCGALALAARAWKEASQREKAISCSRLECFYDMALCLSHAPVKSRHDCGVI